MMHFRFFLCCMSLACSLYLLPCKGQSALVLPAGDHTIPLEWYRDSSEAYAALLIPVTLPHCQPCYMQFDLGAASSVLYREGLGTGIADTVSSLPSFSFKTGNTLIGARNIPVISQPGPFTAPYRIIGTIGADLIDQKIAVIDYPGKALFIGNDIPAELQEGLALSPFVFSRRKVLLPATIRGKQTLLYFDTGSSAYALLTDEQTCLSMALPGSVAAVRTVSSWGRQLTAHTVPTRDSIFIGGGQLPIQQASYITGASEAQTAQMRKIGIGGVTGNRLFLHSILVLDTRRQLFGIRKAPGN
jgi:hypothetical protein